MIAGAVNNTPMEEESNRRGVSHLSLTEEAWKKAEE